MKPKTSEEYEQEFLLKEARHARGEQLQKVGTWVLGAVIIFFIWFNHHQHAQNDPIPSQAWSFGEPGQ